MSGVRAGGAYRPARMRRAAVHARVRVLARTDPRLACSDGRARARQYMYLQAQAKGAISPSAGKSDPTPAAAQRRYVGTQTRGLGP